MSYNLRDYTTVTVGFGPTHVELVAHFLNGTDGVVERMTIPVVGFAVVQTISKETGTPVDSDIVPAVWETGTPYASTITDYFSASDDDELVEVLPAGTEPAESAVKAAMGRLRRRGVIA